MALSALILVIQGASAVHRGARGQSDLGVFYRTAVLLSHGADGSLYAGHDSLLGWYRCIPPAGMMWFAPMAAWSPRAASLAWVGQNIVFAVVGALALRAFLRAIEREKDGAVEPRHAPSEAEDETKSGWGAATPWALGLFFLMAGSSLQVGQFSLMFAACWLLALWCVLSKRLDLAALVLATPAAIKIYPALMLLAPLCVLRPKQWPRFVGVFALGFAFWTWGAPSLFYGARTPGLQSAFWHNVVMSPTGRLSESQSTSASSSHGVDTVLLRFLSSAPEPKGAPPHLNLEPKLVLRLVNPLRALLVLATIAFWLRRVRVGQIRSWLDSLALWSAVLFLILPGAKSRYAVYAFAAFLPMLLHLLFLFEQKSRQRWSYCAFLAIVFLLVMSFAPTSARLWGAGFWGALLLWIENGRLLRTAHAEVEALIPRPTKT